MKTRMFVALFLTVFAVLPAASQNLEFRYIGNAAFEIWDGETTLLTDFPYQSGAYGYMEYREEDIVPRGQVLSLVTHGHADHFDSGLFMQTGWKVIAPPEVASEFHNDRVIELREEIRFNKISVYPVSTPHAGIEHYSYLVSWNGRKVYFTGDTGSADELLQQHNLDMVFITPWLLRTILSRGEKIPAKNVIVYHRQPDEEIDFCPGCLVPEQGEVFYL